MKARRPDLMKNVLPLALFATFLAAGASQAATVLISPTVNNGSFESVNGTINTAFTTKIAQWDGSANGEIDNWTVWTGVSTAANDSGTQIWTGGPQPPAGPEGVRFAFLQPGNAVANMTTYTVQAGDVFTFSWDHVGTRNLSHTVSLVYFDGTSMVALSGTSVNATASGTTYGGTFTIAADSAAIGRTIGIGIQNTSTNWAEVDNFNLSVTSVPEPSVALLGAAGLLAFARRRRAC